MEKNQKLACIYAVISVALWSTVASAFKITLRYINYLQLLFLSSLTAVVILGIILLSQKKIKLLKDFNRKDYLNSILLGLFNPFLYYVVLFKAYSILPAQEAISLNYLWPVVLTLLSIPMLKQKIGKMSIIAILISFAGAFIIATHGNITDLKFENPGGVALALFSTVIWAFFWILNIKDRRDEVVKLFVNFLFGFIFISIAVVISGTSLSFEIPGTLGSVYTGLFEMGITFVLWLKALKLSRTTAKVSNLIYLSPFFSLIIIKFAVGEKILVSTIIGLVLIVAGILLQRRTEVMKRVAK